MRTMSPQTGVRAGLRGERQLADPHDPPKSLAIAERGIRTSSDFANMMSCLMSDLATGRVTPQVGNAMCNAGGKLLKVVEMQQRYGSTSKDGQRKELMLADEPKPAS